MIMSGRGWMMVKGNMKDNEKNEKTIEVKMNVDVTVVSGAELQFLRGISRKSKNANERMDELLRW